MRHSRAYWLIVAAAALAGIVLLSGLLAQTLGHGREGDTHERALRDSLVVARTQTAQALEVAAGRESVYVRANASLDSLLRLSPEVVYRRLPPRKAPSELLGASQKPQTAPGDTLEPLVPLGAYTALQSRCSEFQTACDSLLLAKDTVEVRQHRQIGALTDLLAEQERLERRRHTAVAFGRVRDVGLGVGTGFVLHWLFGGR